MSKDQDITTLQEYIISGIVLLFFGWLYFYLSNDFNFNSDDRDYPARGAITDLGSSSVGFGAMARHQDDNVKTPDTTLLGSNAVLRPPQELKQQLQNNTVNGAIVAGATTSQLTSPQNKLATDQPKPTVAPIEKAEQLASTPVDKQSSTPTPETVEIPAKSVDPVPLDNPQAKLATTEKEAVQVSAKVKEQISESSDSYILKLPSGRKVEILKGGFEDKLKQAAKGNTVEKAIIFDRVYFKTGSPLLNKKSTYQIAATAAILNTYQDINIVIRGHSDNQGSFKLNTELSLMRSRSMKKALVQYGINGKRIKIEGLGEVEPIASNKTKRGRRRNRRIEIMIQGTQ
ncbi:MAG: OmpA family protein [Cocleimonas sp.]|nr:OmpA family protein [Cocleimonas sp.]